MRKRHLRCVGLFAILTWLFMVPAMAGSLDEAVAIDLRAQPLGDALRELAKQSGLQLLFDPGLVEGRQAPAVAGKIAPRTVLRRLLRGTTLEAHEQSPGVLIVRPRVTERASVPNETNPAPVSNRAPETASAFALEEVIVTAQKREEKLQDVPISITAIGGEELEDRGVNSLAGLNAIAPNVSFRSSSGTKLISDAGIRGSTAGGPAIWRDPSTGLYLNGVYLGKSMGSVFSVVDVERVEVLRGPQGTLFGRNTEGGAINIITRKPSGEFWGSAGVEFGNFDHRAAKFSVDLPRFGIASISLAGRKEERDGWARNLTGPDMGAIDNEAARASIKLDFTDSFDALYEFDYSNADNTPPVSSLYSPEGWRGTFPAIFGDFLGGAIENAIAPYVTTNRPGTVSTNGGPIWERAKNTAHALTLSYQVADQDELKYIFARRNLDYSDSQDIDGTPLTSLTAGPVTWGLSTFYNRNTEYEQDTHELQWVGNRHRFNYVLGFYYLKDDGVNRGAQNFSLFGSPPERADYATGTRAKAIFGQADYRINDRWTLTVGARYTEEEKSGWTHRFQTVGFDGPFLTDSVPGTLPFTAYSADFSDTTPMAALSFKPTDDLNFYARVAKGFKSGGFSSEVTDPRVTTPFQPQNSVSSEVGMKSTLLDGRARFNLALYHTDITDQHTSQLLPGTTQSFVVNAGESTYQGVEIEAALLIADGWRVQLGYGYLDTKYDKFIDNALNIPGRPLIDTASNRVAAKAPEHTLNVNLDGRLLRTNWGDLRALLDYSYVAEMHSLPLNKDLSAPNAGGTGVVGINTVPSMKNLNARLLLAGIPAGPGTLDLSLWGQNLTNEDKMIQQIDFSMFINATWQDPRSYMFTATYKW